MLWTLSMDENEELCVNEDLLSLTSSDEDLKDVEETLPCNTESSDVVVASSVECCRLVTSDFEPESSGSGKDFASISFGETLSVSEESCLKGDYGGRDMSEKERGGLRNKVSKVERSCSNAAHSSASGSQSRNHLHQHHRLEAEARNRPHEKTQNSGRNQNMCHFDRKTDSASEDGTVDSDNVIVDDDDNNEDKVGATSSVLNVPPFPYLTDDMPLPAGKGSLNLSMHVMHNWQATKSTIKERLGFMFCNELLADVHFIVGKGAQRQRIPAHKFVLSIGSAVFDAMFNGGMATADEEIELPDVEPAAFLCLIRFFYSDEVKIGPDTVMASLYAAKKYAVPALERGCVDYLKKHLSSDNSFMLLTQARLFDEPQLAAMCLEMIDKTTTEALVADGFTDIDLDTLCIVLERDTLGIKECKLFAAVTRWAEAECSRQGLPLTSENQRLVLGRALLLIRFPLMTVEEFAVGAAQSGILTDREVVELFLYFTVNPKPSVNFSDVLRCCLTGKEQVVSRFCEIENRWGYSGTSDRIRFMVNRKIFIVGFGLYGSIHSPTEYAVNIQIIHTDTGHVCGINDTSFLSDGSTSTFRVMFKEPVEIQPNTSYTASATLKGPDTYYGAKGLRKVTHESVASGKVVFQFTYAAGNNNGTSVEDGQIPEIVFYTSDPIG